MKRWDLILKTGCLGLLAGISLSACTQTVQSEDLRSFGTAANDISEQAELAFTKSNRLARDVSIDRFVRSGAVGLTEDSFLVAIKPDDREAWSNALTSLSDYANGLASLVDTSRASETSDALVELANRINSSQTTSEIGVKIGPRVATGLSSLAGAVLNARTQSQARNILQQTDPAIQEMLAGMAEAIGTSNGEGLRGTVWSNWTDASRAIRSSYADAAERKEEAIQRLLVGEYLQHLDARDVHLRSLANLRTSIVNLATAHAAAANGGPATVDSMLDRIGARLEETKRLYAAIEKPTETEGGN